MAKRYTDNTKWDDPFFSDLSNDMKIVWLYILDKCDHAGIYKLNYKLLKYQCDTRKKLDEIKECLNGRIFEINQEKWFILKFIKFQYGALSENNRVHNSVINVLIDNALWDIENSKIIEIKGHTRPLEGSYVEAKDKDQDKDKVKNKLKDKDKENSIPPNRENVLLYFKEKGFENETDRFIDFYTSKGWMVGKNKMKDWKATVRNWLRGKDKFNYDPKDKSQSTPDHDNDGMENINCGFQPGDPL